MNSIYKWKLSLENLYVYLVSEDTQEPFIYDSSTNERTYSDHSETRTVDESQIADNVPVIESEYERAFNRMIALVGDNGYQVNNSYNLYYNIDNSACVKRGGDGGLCPSLTISATSIRAGEDAYAEMTGYSVSPDGTKNYQYMIYVPEGEKGDKGDRGERGVQGAQGNVGPQGTQGPQGERGSQGANGVSPEAEYTSFIFKRSNTINPASEKIRLDAAQYGVENDILYNDPMYGIESVGWSDSIPAVDGSGNSSAVVWMSKKVFSTDDDKMESDPRCRWSEPADVSDSASVEYEWNTWERVGGLEDGKILTLEDMINTYPPLRTSPDDLNPGTTYDADGKDSNGWYDNPVSGAVWMAVREVANGEYSSSWEISRIKGEQGDAGEPLALREGLTGDEFYHVDCNPNGIQGSKVNEARTCTEDSSFSENCGNSGVPAFKKGHLYVWDGDNWIDAGIFAGQSAYIHIKYANEATPPSIPNPGADNYIDYLDAYLEWTDENGETPNGDYIGICTDDNFEDPSGDSAYKLYKWTKGKGEDGFGYEYIYCHMKQRVAPDVPILGTQYSIAGTKHEEYWESGDTCYQNNFDFVPYEVTVGGRTQMTDEGDVIQWHDDFISPTKAFPYVYEAYRKRNSNGTWTQFYGEDDRVAALKTMYAVSPDYKSFIFKRDNAMYGRPDLVIAEGNALRAASTGPEGGTYDNPVPTTPTGWSDGVPPGEEVLWMSQRTFSQESGKDTTSRDSKYAWTDPVLADDTEDIDREWNPNPDYANVYVPDQMPRPQRTSPDDNNPGVSSFNPDEYGWYDNPQNGTIWYAECEVVGGKYKLDANGRPDWKLSRIVGENGKDGKDGTSIIADLTNEMDGIALGDDMFLDADVELHTVAYIMSGVTKIRPTNVVVGGPVDGYHITATTSVTNDQTGIEITINFYGESRGRIQFAESGETQGRKTFELLVSYQNGAETYEKTIVYTVVGIRGGKDGQIYRLATNVDYVAFDQSGDPSTRYVSCKAYLGDMELDPPDFTIYYTIGVTPVNTTGFPMRIYPYGESGVTVSDITDKGIVFYLVHGNSIVDRETIPYVRDGKDGSGTCLLEIFNEYDSVFLGDTTILGDEAPDSFTGITFTTSMALFSGDTPLILKKDNSVPSTTPCGIKIYAVTDEGEKGEIYNGTYTSKTNSNLSISIVGIELGAYDGVSSGKATVQIAVPDEFAFNDLLYYQFEFEVTGRNADNELTTRSGRYKIFGLKGGKDGASYKLYPTANVLQYDPNERRFDPSSINCYAYNGTEKVDTTLSSATREAYILYQWTDEAIEPDKFNFNNLGTRGSDWDLLLGEENSMVSIPTTNTRGIAFYLISGETTSSGGIYTPVTTGFKVLDVEPVGMAKNGLNGVGSLVTNLSNDSVTISLGGDGILNTTKRVHTRIYVKDGGEPLDIQKYTIEGWYRINTPSSKVLYEFVPPPGTYSATTTDDAGRNLKIEFEFHETYDDIYITVESGASFVNDSSIEFIINPIYDGYTMPSAIFTISGVNAGKDGADFNLYTSVDDLIYNPNSRTFNENIEDILITPYYDHASILNYIGNGENQYFSKAAMYYTIGYTEDNLGDLLQTANTKNNSHLLWSATTSSAAHSATLIFSGTPLLGEVVIPAAEDFMNDPRFIVFYLMVWDKSGNYISPIPDREMITVSKDGRDGAGFVVVDLDNEIEVLGVDTNRTLDVNVSAETGVKAYHGTDVARIVLKENPNIIKYSISGYGPAADGTTAGTQDLLVNEIIKADFHLNDGKTVTSSTIINGTTYVTTEHLNISFALSGSTEHIRFDGIYQRRQIMITLTVIDGENNFYNGVSKVFTIIGIEEGKDGQVLRLVPTASAIRVDASKTPFPGSIGCVMTDNLEILSGVDSNIFVSFDNVLNSEIELNDALRRDHKVGYKVAQCYTAFTDTDGGIRIIDITPFTTPDLIADKTITFYYTILDTSGNVRTILDRETVPLLYDGKDGEGFAVLEFDNEIEAIGVGGNQILESAVTATTGIKMFHGSDPLTISSITVGAYDGIASSADTNTLMGLGKITTAVTYSSQQKAAKLEIGFDITGTSGDTIDFRGVLARRQFSVNVVGSDTESSYTVSKVFTVIGIKEGDDGHVVKLLPSVNAIKVSFSQSTAADMSPDNITCKLLDGVEDKGTSDIYVSFDVVCDTWVDITNNTGVTHDTIEGKIYKKAMQYNDAVSNVSGNNVIKLDYNAVNLVKSSVTFYYIVSYEENGTTSHVILDREVIPVVYDGRDGAGSVTIDMENENDTVSLGGDNILGNNAAPGFTGVSLTTGSIKMYSGTTALSISNVSVVVSGQSGGPHTTISSNDGTAAHNGSITASTRQVTENGDTFYAGYVNIDLPTGFVFNAARHYTLTITVTGGTDNVVRSAIYTLNGLLDGKDGAVYRIVPSLNEIVFDGDTNEPLMSGDTIYIKAFYSDEPIDGGEVNPNNSVPINKMYYYKGYDTPTLVKAEATTEGALSWSASYSAWTLEVDSGFSDDYKIILYLDTDANSANYTDFETIPLINNGADLMKLVLLGGENGFVGVGSDGILDIPAGETYTISTQAALMRGDEVVSFELSSMTISGISGSAIQGGRGYTLGSNIKATASTNADSSVTITFGLPNGLDLNSPVPITLEVTTGPGKFFRAKYIINGNKNAADPSFFYVDPTQIVLAVDKDRKVIASSTVAGRAWFVSEDDAVFSYNDGLRLLFNNSAGTQVQGSSYYRVDIGNNITVDITYTASGECTFNVNIPSTLSLAGTPLGITASTSYKSVTYSQTIMFLGIKEGSTGTNGKMLYPAGNWDYEKEYCVTETTAPYVYFSGSTSPLVEEGYYYLGWPDGREGCVTGVMPGSAPWNEMEQFDAIYSNVMISKFGKFGESIFYDEYMFSQEGTEYTSGTTPVISSTTSKNYDLFLVDKYTGANMRDALKNEETTIPLILSNSRFIPNIFINFRTGEIHMSRVDFKGTMRNPFLHFSGTTSSTSDDLVATTEFTGRDNICIYSDSSKLKLPCDAMQNGRRLILMANQSGLTSDKKAKLLLAKPTAYFYEDGIQKSALYLNNETVELIGFGPDDNQSDIYGWVVLNRKNALTNGRFGHPFNVLAYGNVAVDSTGNITASSQTSNDLNYYTSTITTFDGTQITTSWTVYTASTSAYLCVKREAVGRYRIYFPSRWAANWCLLWATPFAKGEPHDSTTAPFYKTTYANISVGEYGQYTENGATYNYIPVFASYFDTSNSNYRYCDASFRLLIFNGRDWLSLIDDGGDRNITTVTYSGCTVNSFTLNNIISPSTVSVTSAGTMIRAAANVTAIYTTTYGDGTSSNTTSTITTFGPEGLSLSANSPYNSWIVGNRISVPENTGAAKQFTVYLVYKNQRIANMTVAQAAATGEWKPVILQVDLGEFTNVDTYAANNSSLGRLRDIHWTATLKSGTTTITSYTATYQYNNESTIPWGFGPNTSPTPSGTYPSYIEFNIQNGGGEFQAYYGKTLNFNIQAYSNFVGNSNKSICSLNYSVYVLTPPFNMQTRTIVSLPTGNDGDLTGNIQ